MSFIEPFSKGSHLMWEDPHISGQLLQFHLDPSNDAASRRPETIERTVNWLNDEVLKGPSRILDLGCGPGLYCERLKKLGHDVIGMDISPASIEFAREQTRKNESSIEYIHRDYLEEDLPTDFDLAMIIYCDLGVFGDADRDKLLSKIFSSLKKGGSIVFDLPGPSGYDELKESINKEIGEEGGFWSPGPYIHTERVFKYQEPRTILHDHSVVLEDNEIRTYRFWDRFYSREEIEKFLGKAGFSNVKFKEGIVEDSNFRTSDIIFISAKKK